MAIGRQFVDSQPPGVDPRNLTPLHQHLYRPHDVDLMQWDVSQTHHHDRKYDKVNRCLARYSPRATTTNRPTNRALKKPAWPGPN